MVYQYYVVEIQQYTNGDYGHIVHWAFDADADKARLKGEAKFHEVLAAAAVSELPSHSAIMFSTDGFPIMHQCYKHDIPIQPEPQPEPVDEGNSDGEQEETPDVNSLFN